MIRCGLRLVAATVLLVGCGPSAPPSGVFLTTIVGAGVGVTFAGGQYQAFGAQSEPSDPPDGTLLVIPLETISSIGLATQADPILFPDRTVFQIRDVNPHDAVVMFDRSTRVPELLVLTRDGVSPTVVPGLCDYYADPKMQLCRAEATSAP